MDLAVVTAAERNNKLITDLASECPTLRKPEMVRICRPSSANQARLSGDRSDVIPVTHPAGFGHCQQALADCSGAKL
jgi:hypothetical protein